jgi:glucan phosphoethanolaminetransferase (alkaline phosphatase superfamily)
MPRRAAFNAPRTVLKPIADTHPRNNIVFIVDESVRGDHLSLNGYGTKTTPLLDELSKKGLLKNWGIAAAGGTCSVQSNNLLLTGMRIEPDPKFTLYRLPTVFQYARMMGYRTYLFDGQTANLWLGKPGDLEVIDHKFVPEDLHVERKRDTDASIALRINTLVQGSIGNFIWVNKAGVHKPYTDAYPNESGERPDNSWFVWYDKSAQRDELVRTYDKAIEYNSRTFFENLLPSLNPAPNTIYIYTSDHGQTLMENGATVSHCSDTKLEAIVPLFLIADSSVMPRADTGFAASHANIFPTILDLMNVPVSDRPYEYEPSLLTARSGENKTRHFFAGEVSEKPAGTIIPFDP